MRDHCCFEKPVTCEQAKCAVAEIKQLQAELDMATDMYPAHMLMVKRAIETVKELDLKGEVNNDT